MNLIPFEYEKKQIRVIQDDGDGKPWWIVRDVCGILDLGSPHKAIERLDEDERKTFPVIDAIGRNQETWCINEPGLYSLILRSYKPEAKNFKRWITHEVLPAIRSTGKYEIDTSSEIDLIIRSAQALKNIETKQIEHDQRLSLLEAKSQKNSGFTGYWTITAWCKLNRYKIGIEEATRKGREATRLSHEWGVEICRVPDERFGMVNSYREDVLEEIFDTSPVNA